MIERHGNDVTIHAPSAISGVRDLESLKTHSPGEYAQELERNITMLELKLREMQVAMDTFTTIIAAFVKVASEQMGGGLEVMLDRKVIDRMDGSKVTVNEAPGTRDVLVRIREGVPHPLWEGRHG